MKRFNQLNQPLRLFSTEGLLLFIMIICLGILTSCSEDSEVLRTPENSINAIDSKMSPHQGPGEPELLVTGLQGALGSTIGPGGDLFVVEGAVGQIARIDPKTGEKSVFASGLPPWIIGLGGVSDVVFIGVTAYALVTLVGPQFGSADINGIYRIDGPDSYTIIADLGQYSLDNPPVPDFFVDMGVQYAIDVFHGAFLVTDGHHNRLLHVTTDGEISEFRAFDNIVPTGLEVHGNTIYMGEAGPVPHVPEEGKVISFTPQSTSTTEIASGMRLLVDVEMNRGQTLFGLSQGVWNEEGEGSPAYPETGALYRINADGSISLVVGELNLPSSLEFIKNKAYIINLAGEVWTIDNVADAPFGF